LLSSPYGIRFTLLDCLLDRVNKGFNYFKHSIFQAFNNSITLVDKHH